MSNLVKKIVIVGGGTAGWLSACYLRRALPKGVEITLIESPNVPSVGVGEATIPTLRSTLNFIGLPQEEWLDECQATAKLGIRFDGWVTGDKSERYYHPFTARGGMNISPLGETHFPTIGEGFPYALYWMQQAAQGKAPNFADATSAIPALCEANKFSFKSAKEHRLVYAYQFDAALFAKRLTRHAITQGVRHISDNVVETNLDEQGAIKSVRSENNGLFEGDFFLDCTGFRGVLISKALKEKFLDEKKYLINDSAIALQAALIDDEEGDRPFTLSTAMKAGWSWRVPLQHRFGNGYVFSSAHLSPDDAERELREALGDRAKDYEARLIKLRIGRRERFWVKNCLAVGLSGSFIEPLESTSIFFTEFQLANLLNHFPNKDENPVLRAEYNRKLVRVYEQVRDFIALHFGTSQREDTSYWKAIKYEVPLPPGALEILERFKNGVLPVQDSEELRIFRLHGVMSVLSGMGLKPERAPNLPAHLDDASSASMSAAFLANLSAEKQSLLESVPLYNARL